MSGEDDGTFHSQQRPRLLIFLQVSCSHDDGDDDDDDDDDDISVVTTVYNIIDTYT